MKESVFQHRVIKWLREEQGCYVIKNSAVSGVPVGCPDIFFCKGNFYGFIEAKPSEKAKFQPLQKITLDKLDAWAWARVAYPENWEKIKKELVVLLADK